MMKALLILLLTIFCLSACEQMEAVTALISGKEDAEIKNPAAFGVKPASESAMEHALKHADPSYICPMHPQIVKNEEGDCPICGMDLVMEEAEPVAAATKILSESAVEHALKHADPTYICPMHPQIVKNEEGDCPICGMDLVPEAVEPAPVSSATTTEGAVEHALKHADPNYVCPMHPQIIQGEPGSCPICGMDLVAEEVTPVTTAAAEDFPEIRINAAMIQNMGLRTEKVTKTDLATPISTLGKVEYDEDSIRHVHVRAAGWVEKLNARREGENVRRGEVLFSYYAPEILSAQQELAIPGGSRVLRDAARERLRLLNVPESVIKRIESKGRTQRLIPVLAPASGVIAEIGFRQGMYLKPEMTLYRLADLSSVWVNVDVFEHQFDWIKVGNKAEISVAALPGRIWQGRIDYIYPELEADTRTLKVRLKFDNKDGELKPNMFANARLWSTEKQNATVVPREAVILSGSSSRVVKRLPDGSFQPVMVETGMSTDAEVEILSGLDAGEEIVVSGQFLIDSESNLQASFRRMRAKQ